MKVFNFHQKMMEFLKSLKKNDQEERKIVSEFLTSPEIEKFKNQILMFTGYELN